MNDSYTNNGQALIVFKSLSIVFFSLLNQGCSDNKGFNSSALSSQIVSNQVNVSNTTNNELTNQARKITTKYNLSSLPLSCLKFDIQEEVFEGKDIISVREKHGGRCNGDPNTSPRLFSIGIERISGAVWSDQKSTSGQFEKLKAD